MSSGYLWTHVDGVIRIVARRCRHMKEFENIDFDNLGEDVFAFIYGALRPGAEDTGVAS